MNRVKRIAGKCMIMINYLNIILFFLCLIGLSYAGSPSPPAFAVKHFNILLTGLVFSIIVSFIIRYIRWKYTY